MSFEPLAITGMGLVAPSAGSPAELWQRACECQSPARLWQGLPAEEGKLNGEESPEVAVCPVTESLDLPPLPYRLRRLHRADRTLRLALLAAARAWQDAGLAQLPPGDLEEVAVIAGTSRGPVGKWLAGLATKEGKRSARLLPSLAAESTFASLHGSLAAAFGTAGPAFTVSTACASGAHAMALAADQLRSGSATIALVGAADAPLYPWLLRQFAATGILDPALPPSPVCRPFDQSAAGTVLGEAGAFLVLETLSSARRREARVHGLLSGWGMAADGAAPSAEAAGKRALPLATVRALARAHLTTDQLGYLNTHGTGTLHNDALELSWLRTLPQQMPPLPFGSTKAVTGHCLGATPVLEAILCLQTLQHRLLLPSAHCREPHPLAPPGVLLRPGQPLLQPHAMSNSIGFWGAAVSLIFSRPG